MTDFDQRLRVGQVLGKVVACVVQIGVHRKRLTGRGLICKAPPQSGADLTKPNRFSLVLDRCLPKSNELRLGLRVSQALLASGNVLGAPEGKARF